MASNTPMKGFRIKNFWPSRSKDRATTASSSLGPVATRDSSATNPALPGPDNDPPPRASEQQKLGLVLLTPDLPADQIDERFPDIIAIHGICGDPLKTWTHESGALWLRDFLPKDINGARVFSFGYDSEVALTRSLATLDDFARSLLNKIKLERDGKQQSRPLIFICHSMGGIVLKRALAIARLEDEDEFPFLRTSIRGIFFLGTPHNGSDAVKWPQLLANISSVGLYIVDRHTGILGFPGEIIIPMDGCDHRTMCRFLNEKDQNYRVLKSRINELLDTSEKTTHGQSIGAQREISPKIAGHHQELKTTDEKDCLKYLYFKDMEARKHEIAPATEATCEWLLKHNTFQEWTLQNRGLLWIKGNPGTGKSTMMKYALQKMSPCQPTTQSKLVILSFFFHGRGSDLQHTPLGFYRSILHQILDQVPSALSDLVNDFRKSCEVKGYPGEKWDWHETELRAFLKSSIPKILEYYSIRIFADALDESGETAAVELVKVFQSLISRCPNTSSSVFSICFSCRRYPIIDFEGELEICIDRENSKDIRTYIQSQLNNEKHQIRETIIQRASNSFQWARLVVDLVQQMRRQAKKEKTIKEEILRIPPNLNDFYRELLETVSQEEKPEVLSLFQWILFAIRPLSLDELRFATAIDPDLPYTSLRQCEDEGILAENNKEMETRVKSISRGLAEVQPRDNIPVVQFIHQSVNDFLFDDGLQILHGESWESLDLAIGLAHHSLSRSCIRYTDMEEIVQRKSIDWSGAAKSELYFLHYAITSWVPHAEQAYAKRIPQVDLIDYFHWPLQDLLEQWVDIYNRLDRYSENCPCRKTTLLHIACRYGIVDLLLAAVRTMKDAEVKVDSEDDHGRTPLSRAAGNGHGAIVQLLLDTGKVDADSKDEDSKVDANLKDERGQTPLLWAALFRHEAIVHLLLNIGKVEVDLKDKDD
ncbi:hypothetical protein VF21_09923 [Pseudogymnoascus sp. 05NY08]|nr:hypothetical protein VF21_09923 [Pseudogymnoascus sp. 05NY08]